MSSSQPIRESMDAINGQNHQILRINSGANELDELFKAVMGPKDSQIPLSVPMRQRNFPASFFKPPDAPTSAQHSRDSSLDASFSSPLSQPSGSPLSPASPQQPPTIQQQMNGLPSGIVHSRAHSSPASLNQTLAVSAPVQQQQQQAVHSRQLSYDLNHIPMPTGWQMSKTESGETYFIDHINKKTQWEDPRIKFLPQPLQQQLQRQPPLVGVPQTNNNAINNINSASTGNLTTNAVSGPLPDGWEVARTESGELYFISHIENRTTWVDPRHPDAAQLSRAQQHSGRTPPPPFSSTTVPSSLVVALQNMNTSGTTVSTNADALRLQQQHQRTVMNLQLERQRLRQRQNEIRQNFLSKPSSLVDDSTPNRLPPISTTGIDPFLGGSNSALNNDCHSRQESADSGLGLGSNYSLPHTPEDFLNIEDALNNRDDANNNISRNTSNDLSLDTLAVGNLDLGTENMESDDLVPSLADDFSADLLSNVEELLDTNRDNIMTWL